MSGDRHERNFLLLLFASAGAHGLALWTGRGSPQPTLNARPGIVGIEARLAPTSPVSAATPILAPDPRRDPLTDEERPPELKRTTRAAARPSPKPRAVATTPLPLFPPPPSPPPPLPTPRPPFAPTEWKSEVSLMASVAGIGSEGAVPQPIGVRSPARLVGELSPLYPSEARRLGHEGKVVLRLWIAASGTVEEAKVETSSGSELLDRAALDFGRAARFEPASDGHHSVPSEALLPVAFRLVPTP